MKTDLVLLHGAGLGGWIWDRLIPKLKARAIVVDRTREEKSLEDRVRSVLAHIAGDARVILVGHSIGAEVAMIAAARRPDNIVGVISIGGTVPESGKSFLSLMPLPQRLFLRMLLRRETIALPPSMVRKSYCNDLDEETTALVLRNLEPELSRLYLDRAEWSAVPATVKRAYVKLLADKSVPPKQQDSIARRIGARDVETIHSGHLPMLARPEETARLLDDLATSMSTGR